MDQSISIESTTPSDLQFVYGLFDQSILYQEKHGYPVWKNYDKGALVNDVNNGNHYKILIGGQIAMVFSVSYTDKILWREMENGNSIYLHRIVVNPLFRGQRLFGLVLEWALVQAKKKRLKSIRIDTWAEDTNIIEYYKTFGFRFIEDYLTPDTEELPKHNRNIKLALLERDLTIQ